MLSELPSDLTLQDRTLGPPPSWWRESSTDVGTKWYPVYFFGDIDMNPMELIAHLKLNQQYNTNIPSIARRYTKIDPDSPLFKDNKSSYGFGDLSDNTKTSLALFIITPIIYAVIRYLDIRHNLFPGFMLSKDKNLPFAIDRFNLITRFLVLFIGFSSGMAVLKII